MFPNNIFDNKDSRYIVNSDIYNFNCSIIINGYVVNSEGENIYSVFSFFDDKYKQYLSSYVFFVKNKTGEIYQTKMQICNIAYAIINDGIITIHYYNNANNNIYCKKEIKEAELFKPKVKFI